MCYISPLQLQSLLKKHNCVILNKDRRGIYTMYNFITQNGNEMRLTTKTQNANTTLSMYVVNLNNKLVIPTNTHLYKETNTFTDDNINNLISLSTLINILQFNIEND